MSAQYLLSGLSAVLLASPGFSVESSFHLTRLGDSTKPRNPAVELDPVRSPLTVSDCVYTSGDQLQKAGFRPPNPPTLGGIGVQSPSAFAGMGVQSPPDLPPMPPLPPLLRGEQKGGWRDKGGMGVQSPPLLGDLGGDRKDLCIHGRTVSEQTTVTPYTDDSLSNAIAQEINLDEEFEADLVEVQGQVTSVSQLSDVQPTDWAFQALQSLVERYGCIAGYPDGSYKGNRAMTRYEFAAGVYACLERVNELIAASVADKVTREDLAVLQRLQEEFAAELAGLRGRIQALEARTAELEANQFSTTTVFGGEAIFGLAIAGGGDPPGNGDDRQLVFHHLLRLGTVSSFSGLDRLRIGLVAGNFANRGFAGTFENPSLGTDMALLSYQTDTDNDIVLDSLEYRFPAFSNRVVFTVRPVGFSLSDILTANSPFFDTGRGAISRFGEASPLFKIGALEGGAGFDWLVADWLRFQFAYGTRGINDARQGISGSDHSALGAQFLIKPSANTLAGIHYMNAYASDGRLDTLTGSFNADTSGLILEPMQFHGVGGSFQWRIHRQVTLAAWGGAIFGQSTTSDAYANTTTYTVSVGVSDPFGREGDLFGFIFGQPPKLVAGQSLALEEDPDTALHFEAFYRFRLNDHIWITPGAFLVTSPEHDSDNDTIVIGVLRGSFLF